MRPGASSSLNLFTEQPMFWAACAYASGVAAASVLWRPMSWWLVASLILMAGGAVFLRSQRIAAVAVVLAGFFTLGALHAELSAATQPAPLDISRFTDGNEVVVTAHVVRTGLPRRSSAESPETDRREVIDVETEAVNGTATVFGIRVTVRSLLAADTEDAEAFPRPTTAFVYGERLRFPAKLRQPRNYGNPGAMDYRGYLQGKGIAALASVSVEKFEKLPGVAGSRWEGYRQAVRSRLSGAMLSAGHRDAPWWQLSEEDSALLLAMVIGEQSLLERVTRTDFQRTGLFHILVVSGMNVGMLALFVFWAARRLRAGPWLATWATVVVCLLYVAVTDLGTPVLRAAVMLCLYLVARMLFRDRFSLNAVGTAAGILLLYDPRSLFEASFQLTFLSMVALSGIVQPLLQATSQPYEQALRGLELTGWDPTLPPKIAQFRLDLRLISAKLTRLVPAPKAITWLLTRTIAAGLHLYDLVTVSVIMQLALALPMTFYFHRMALLGVPANILVVPLTAVLVPAALLATLLQLISGTIASVIWMLCALCLEGVLLVVRTAAGVRFADARYATPEPMILVTCAALLGLSLLLMRRRAWLQAAGLAALVLAAALATSPPHPRIQPGVMEVTAIDVGQGDALLLVTPDGKTLLIDAGGPAGPFRTDNFDLGEDVVSPYLWSRGITRLDAVAVTHAHSDHLAGMSAVLANFRPRELWLGIEADPQRYAKLRATARDHGVEVKNHYTGESLDFGDVRIKVLNPPRELQPRERRNEDSLVLQATYRQSSVLLTGDAEKRTEDSLVRAVQPASLLKVAHHGSGTSTTPELLAKAQPQYAVISAGYRNLYGHPRADVLARLREAHVRTYRTDVSGAVTFYLDGTATTVALPQR